MAKTFPCNDEPILREQDASGARIFEALVSFPEDFMSEGREDTPPQEREFVRVADGELGRTNYLS